MLFPTGRVLIFAVSLFMLIGADDPAAVNNRVTLSIVPKPQCAQSTTLSFCLDDATYPNDDIQREINANYGVFYKMYADVANQSTASLVDGLGGEDEAKYDYAFYYGDRRNSLSGSTSKDRPVYSNYVFRDDYYKEGGYVCPAFIEYTSLFQATNARGEWQYIVNLKPWTQTVRLEQCFYPLAPCSFMSPSFKTQCVQKYSYQRLIAYEPHGRGLYTDIFRLPTACSCFIRPLKSSQSLGLLMSDASQSIASNSPSYAPSNAITNGFKPVRVRDPSGRSSPGYSLAASQSSNSWYPDSQPMLMASSSRSDIEAGVPPQQDSRLVERRRVRPDGLSLSDITSDPEVDLSFGNPATGDYQGTSRGGGGGGPPMSYDSPSNHGPPQTAYDSPSSYQQPRQRGGSGGPPSQFQGDESHMEPSYSNGPSPYSGMGPDNGGGGNFNGNGNGDGRGMNGNSGGPGPRMWNNNNNGPPSDNNGPPQGPPRNGQSGDYRMSPGPGYYDYNSGQRN
ncbi:hypothetical protein BV898_11103 [Hypsibius exemplaris]|uniref:Spaetzle domain-containing protein n=1 Tax=Hypsibius exemplaris TaxID=2072580 RepID=A0A1W0WHP9_HYPEX|nr:hypothetical protein BV898_11103 [Hypsibius exemplaris]